MECHFTFIDDIFLFLLHTVCVVLIGRCVVSLLNIGYLFRFCLVKSAFLPDLPRRLFSLVLYLCGIDYHWLNYENVFSSFWFFSSNVAYFLITCTPSPQNIHIRLASFAVPFGSLLSSLKLCQEWNRKKCLLEPKSCFMLCSLAYALLDHCWYRSV